MAAPTSPRDGERLAEVIGRLAVVALPMVVLLPWFTGPWSTLGFHDWDAMEAHRELVRRAIVDHGELPFWNPYACGGFPAWGYVEGATTVVSPWLPLYLLLPMAVAIRLEVLGAALLGAAGAWIAAGRLTRDAAARTVVVASWAVNGRWALQAAVGHTWHLAYALLPWAFVAFEQARTGPPRVGRHAALGAVFALLVYQGGIYPLPHTVLVLCAYAGLLAVGDRTLRPPTSLAGGGAIGLALSAPKLLPMLATFARAPRAIASTERFPLGALWAALTSRQQSFTERPVQIAPYGWHEWGMYVGAALLAILLVGAATAVARGAPRTRALAAVTVLMVALGLGDVFPLGPWPLLHAYVPPFGSLHVPSRFLYPAVLTLGLTAAPGLAWLLGRLRGEGRRPWVAPFAAALAAGLGLDVALVAQQPMAQGMWMVPAHVPPPGGFHHRTDPPVRYQRRDWATPLYPSMLANVGVLHCYGTPPFEGRGALGADDPGYRGLVSIVAGEGEAEVMAWSPNGVEASVHDASPGARLAYDMNFDRGWSAEITPEGGRPSARPAEAWADRVSVPVPTGDGTVRLRYRPPHLEAGLAIAASTVAALALAAAVTRRRRSRERGNA